MVQVASLVVLRSHSDHPTFCHIWFGQVLCLHSSLVVGFVVSLFVVGYACSLVVDSPYLSAYRYLYLWLCLCCWILSWKTWLKCHIQSGWWKVHG